MSFRAFLACMYNTPIDKNDFVQQRDCNCSRVANDSSNSSRWCLNPNVSLVRRKRVLTAYVWGLEDRSRETWKSLYFNKKFFFARTLGGGLGPLHPCLRQCNVLHAGVRGTVSVWTQLYADCNQKSKHVLPSIGMPSMLHGNDLMFRRVTTTFFCSYDQFCFVQTNLWLV